jgi:Icc-related predicted phosphoesterase
MFVRSIFWNLPNLTESLSTVSGNASLYTQNLASSRRQLFGGREFSRVARTSQVRLVCSATLQKVELLSASEKLEQEQACIRLLHFTDIHFHKPSLSGNLPTLKELLGYANLYFAGRRKAFDAKTATKAFIRLVHELEPDLVVFSGDLTSTGTPTEFAMAYEHLRPLLQSKRPGESLRSADSFVSGSPVVIMVAGNHDRYSQKNLYGMELFFGEQMLGGGPVSPHCFSFVTQDTRTKTENATKTSEPLVLITLEHCRPSRWSSGHHYVAGTLERLESLLSKLHARSIVIGHYPVLEPNGVTLYERFGRSLTDVRALSSILRRYPPLAYLCGHHHAGYVVRDIESGFWHINCGSSAKIGFARALEIQIGRLEGEERFRILGINAYPLL